MVINTVQFPKELVKNCVQNLCELAVVVHLRLPQERGQLHCDT